MTRLLLTLLLLGPGAARAAERPNIVLILADDMGYSDIGCFGGEIPTPHIDRLAREGVRFSQFYNTSRCCPTRASLLTGITQHEAGVGMMTSEGRFDFDFGVDGYRGQLNRNCVTLAEVLRSAGYRTYMTGKWHLGSDLDDRPLQRGFDQFYGSLSGAFGYFKPQGDRHLMLGNDPLPAPDPATYYTTDAFADRAVDFIAAEPDPAPFFLYLAFNAPHWPLQAKPEDIAKFEGVYEAGWDILRRQRFERQVELGLFPAAMGFAPRDDQVRAWADIPADERAEAVYRMQVYAAQVHAMDAAIGRLLDHLESTGELDRTLIVFLSDNGACAEPYSEFGGGQRSDINNPDKNGIISYGRGWANLSNTPFREYKNRPQEGGVRTPLVVRWPAGVNPALVGEILPDVGHIKDFMPTLVDVAQADYPTRVGEELIYPMEGRSLLPLLTGAGREAPEYLYFEHAGNCAIRHGNWKAVSRYGEYNWQLYDLVADPLEQHDLAAAHPDLVARLDTAWKAWAVRSKVSPKGTPPANSYH